MQFLLSLSDDVLDNVDEVAHTRAAVVNLVDEYDAVGEECEHVVINVLVNMHYTNPII